VGVCTYTGRDIRYTKVMLAAASCYYAVSLGLLVRQVEAFYFSHTYMSCVPYGSLDVMRRRVLLLRSFYLFPCLAPRSSFYE